MSEREIVHDLGVVQAPSLRNQVYERLREAILAGELAPGERLSASALAGSFGVSAMPVRDALRRLEQEGLVESSARRWTRVVELQPALVHEVAPLVALLEEHAIRSAAAFNGDALDEMERANRDFAAAIKRRDGADAVVADAAFHAALVRGAKNESLERALRDARSRVRLLRARVVGGELPPESIGDHDEILAALREGDCDRACVALRRNWQRGLRRYRRAEA